MAIPPDATQGPDAHASYHTAAKALADLLSYLRTSSEQEHWLLELYKRRCGVWQTRSAEGRKVVAKGSAVGQAGVGGSDSQLTQMLKTLLSATADEGTDCASLETFIRNGPFLTLERNSKSRDAKLKKRTKALLDVLSRFETGEKVLTRSSSELGHEKKRFAQLEERRKLDRAEEIEKVEIDLRRTRSSLSVKQADFDVAHSKMTDIRQLWTSEWEGFRIYVRQLEVDRQAEMRNGLTEFTRASLLAQEAEAIRGRALLARLEAIDTCAQVQTQAVFTGMAQLNASIPTAASSASISAQLWPSRSPLFAAQLASMQAKPRPPALHFVPPERTSSVTTTPVRTPSPREYGEEMFSVPRKAVPPEYPTPRKVSKPLPDAPLDEDSDHKGTKAEADQDDADLPLLHARLSIPPTLPSFTNLKLGELEWASLTPAV